MCVFPQGEVGFSGEATRAHSCKGLGYQMSSVPDQKLASQGLEETQTASHVRRVNSGPLPAPFTQSFLSNESEELSLAGHSAMVLTRLLGERVPCVTVPELTVHDEQNHSGFALEEATVDAPKAASTK